MPELPEVEATVRNLKEHLEGLTIMEATVLWARTVALNKPATFKRQIIGAKIAEVFRRGKFIGIRTTSKPPYFLYTHLRMSVSLDIHPATVPIATHDRVILFLSNGKSLRFNDTRKFGRMYLTASPEKVVGKLGLEPLGNVFTLEILTEMLRARKGAIKPLLLNQGLIVGLGNIYVDESLWRAKIHPETQSYRIPLDKIAPLYHAIRETLSQAILLQGTDFGDGVVDNGMYRPIVYGRTGKPCQRCAATIKRLVVGQRGTHICPTCQRLSKKRAKK